jgi:hypothetical protein
MLGLSLVYAAAFFASYGLASFISDAVQAGL